MPIERIICCDDREAGGRRIKWSVEDMVMFSGIVSVDGPVQFSTAQNSLAPNLPAIWFR